MSKILIDEAVVRQALDALRSCYDVTDYPANGRTEQDNALNTLRAALASKSQALSDSVEQSRSEAALAPAQNWVGLTDEEISEIHDAAFGKNIGVATGLVEKKLKKKNTKVGA